MLIHIPLLHDPVVTVDCLLYTNNKLSYKPRPDLNIYKSCELESTFIEIVDPTKSNVTVG